MATTKRRLPMLKSEPAADDAERPPWHWVVLERVMTFTAWLPLAYVGTTIIARSQAASVAASLVAMVLPLALAAVAGGYLVGRFGKPAGVREALLSGLLTGLVAVALTVLSGAFSPLFLTVVVLTTAFAGGGGALGVKQRPA